MLNTHLSLFTRVEDRSNQAVESSIVPPPAPPPSKTSQQGEEKGNDSSEPNSPQPDDSFSSREEQQPEEGREVFLPSGGGQLCTECAPREEREEQREGEGEVDELLDLHMRMMTSVKTDVSLCFPSFLVSSSLLPPPPSSPLPPPPCTPSCIIPPPSSLLPPLFLPSPTHPSSENVTISPAGLFGFNITVTNTANDDGLSPLLKVHLPNGTLFNSYVSHNTTAWPTLHDCHIPSHDYHMTIT